jgi:glutamyl-tRNA synthetase/nondiscriminating glutamyl-tRNA synthetase
MRLRFAPSPTGHLHVGNARTALFNWLLARGSGGTLVLRIEDTDVDRSSAESDASIIRDLRWMGLDWNEGPDVGGPHGPYRQSERLSLYAAQAAALLNSGHAYHCFCAPGQLEAERKAAIAAGLPVRYSGMCRSITRQQAEARIAAGERPALRFRVPDGREVRFADAVRGEVSFHSDVIGDLVIIRGDGRPAYNFAVVVDDALMEITHVIRGEDHLSNTPRQLLLYEALGRQSPAFAHLPLVLGPDHSPLSKRHGATSVAEFRSKGYLPEALLNYLALLGWSPRIGGDGDDELLPVEELARRFTLAALGRSAGVFDEEKLAWANRHYLKLASPERIAELSVPFFGASGVPLSLEARGLEFMASVVPIATDAVDRLDQVPTRLAFLFDYRPELALADPVIRMEVEGPAFRRVISAFAQVLADAPRLDSDRFRSAAQAVRARTGLKGRDLFHPIRVALTARANGPELDLVVPAIERGAEVPASAGLPPILGCRERAAAFAGILEQTT